MDFLKIAARISAGSDHLLRVYTGPVTVKEIAQAFREAGLNVDSVGTEAIYILVKVSDKSDAINSVLNTLKSKLGKTFGLTAKDFKHMTQHSFLLSTSSHTAGKPLPQDLEDLDLVDEQNFKWNFRPGPRDMLPLCVVHSKPGFSSSGPEETLKDGDVVTWTGKRKFEKSHERDKNENGVTIGWIEFNNEFREVVTPSGFVGWVYWTPFMGNHGFEPVS